MKKTITRLVSFGAIAFLATFLTAQAQTSNYYGNYTNNNNVCTMDAYVCPNGTTVGRTGYNCQFVCPSTSISYSPSYNYTSGCYTYYYNGQTRTTSIVSYNCQAQTQTYYPVATTYTYPLYTYTYPSQNTYYYGNTGYRTYNYCNGSWASAYYGNTNCTNNWVNNGGMYYYTSAAYPQTYNNNYQSGCYYQNGYQVCQ